MRTPIRRRNWGKCELTLWTLPGTEERHDAACLCWECLYELYAGLKKSRGRPWSRDLFRFAWRIHEEKIRALKRQDRIKWLPGDGDWRPFSVKGPTEELNIFPGGVQLLVYRLKDYEKTSVWKIARETLSEERGEDCDPATFSTYWTRVQCGGFRKILKMVVDKKLEILRAEARRFGPPRPGYELDEGLRLALRIRKFIFEQPGKRATRRQIMRKMNANGHAVDAAVKWLEGFHINHQLVPHKLQRKRGGYRNKTTVVYAVEQPRSAGR